MLCAGASLSFCRFRGEASEPLLCSALIFWVEQYVTLPLSRFRWAKFLERFVERIQVTFVVRLGGIVEATS